MDDFLGAQLIAGLVAQLLIREGLEGDAVAVLVFAHQHRKPSQLVAGGDDAVPGQQQNGGRAVDDFLGVADALHQGVLLVDKGGGQFRGVDLAVALGHELMAVVREVGLHQRIGIVDDANGGDGVQAQMGPHQQGLGVGIGDAADAAAPVEIGQIRLKLGAEGGVLNIVDLAVEPVVYRVVDGHTPPAGAQMGVVVHAEKDVKHAIPLGDRSKKTTHG